MGENIPLIGRIVAIADTYDAMTSDRSYRKARPHDAAMARSSASQASSSTRGWSRCSA